MSILLDESNINNQNFILRRSTGFSQAFASVCLLFPFQLDSLFRSLARESLPLQTLCARRSFGGLLPKASLAVHSSFSRLPQRRDSSRFCGAFRV